MNIFKRKLIEFHCSEEDFGVIPPPVPAYKVFPEWFKKVDTRVESLRDHSGAKVMTAKQCMPMLDVMSLGFVMPLFRDVSLRTNHDRSLIEVSGGSVMSNAIEFHDKAQLGGKTSPSYPGPAIKFVNKWVIKTAPGYSTLIVPLMNSMESRFTCLSGLVDTDKYQKEVNFPAIWNISDYDDLLSAGTPLVTVIPIKRSDMGREVIARTSTAAERAAIEKMSRKQLTQRGVYTNELRCPRK